MKTASINELKKEVSNLAPDEIIALCIRLAKYKKENKELLNYLLFEAHDPSTYIKNIKAEITEQFGDVHTSNMYLAKKTLRKILRTTNKYIKYADSKEIEIDLLLFFCNKFKQADLPMQVNTVLYNMYMRQLQKITKSISQLHEDLQHDYLEELNAFK